MLMNLGQRDEPPLTDAEASEMMKSHVAWTGKYLTANDTGQGITFTAHIDTASSQAITGADRVFFIRVEDNRLVMEVTRSGCSDDRLD